MSDNKNKLLTRDLKKLNFYEELNANQFKVDKQGFIAWNTGIYGNDTDNAFPQFMCDLYQNGSSIHQNLVNLRANLLKGNNLQAADTSNAEELQRLEVFIKRRNKVGDNLKTVYSKICQDMALFHGAVLQVIYTADLSTAEIAEVYHVPFQNFRLGQPDEYDRITHGYISTNFASLKGKFNIKKHAVRLPMFNPEQHVVDGKKQIQLIYIKPYSYDYYSIPTWTSGIKAILLEKEIMDFQLNNIRSNMFLSGMLTQKIGAMTEEEISSNADAVEDLYGGGEGKKILLNYVEDIENDKPVFERFAQDTQDKLFEVLLNSAQQSIVTANSAYPILAGIDTQGADLGGSSNRLAVSTAAFYNLVCHPIKEVILGYFNQICDVNAMAYVDVITEPLRLQQPIAESTDLTQDERRKMIYDLPPMEVVNNTNDTPIQ